jgi:hypothetical protein
MLDQFRSVYVSLGQVMTGLVLLHENCSCSVRIIYVRTF